MRTRHECQRDRCQQSRTQYRLEGDPMTNATQQETEVTTLFGGSAMMKPFLTILVSEQWRFTCMGASRRSSSSCMGGGLRVVLIMQKYIMTE
jgi:hypothetical protein